jgi:hypothetical protein
MNEHKVVLESVNTRPTGNNDRPCIKSGTRERVEELVGWGKLLSPTASPGGVYSLSWAESKAIHDSILPLWSIGDLRGRRSAGRPHPAGVTKHL